MKYAFIASCALFAAACIKAPELVIVDHATALEQQAGGSYRGLQDDLDHAAVVPRPAPFTRAQIVSSGAETEKLAIGDERHDGSDATAIDALLRRRCLGEAEDGTLVQTKATCAGHLDRATTIHLVERANRDRWQVWRYLQAKRPRSTLSEVRRVWREVHLQGVVCGGQIQRPDGGWETKKC